MGSTRNLNQHKYCKNMNICYHYIRDFVLNKLFNIEYVLTLVKVVDSMTKRLVHIDFDQFQRNLRVIETVKFNRWRGSVNYGNEFYQRIAL
jgi:hypothetical protein